MPICSLAEETPNHLFFECDFAGRYWVALGFSFPRDANVRQLFEYGAPPCVPSPTASTFFLLTLWNLWKHRNAVVFREQPPSLPFLLKACRDEAHLWQVRLPPDCIGDVGSWLLCLGPARG